VACEAGGCSGKHGYPDKGTALRVLHKREAAKRLKGQGRGARVTVYHCDECRKWHHGTDVRARIKRRIKGALKRKRGITR
jgi:hypothetical protein